MCFCLFQWRYATWGERLATGAGALVAWLCSLGLVAAVTVYGELTSLFVQRHAAAPTTPHAHILRLFGGGALLLVPLSHTLVPSSSRGFFRSNKQGYRKG